jgi:hypothetical protein
MFRDSDSSTRLGFTPLRSGPGAPGRHEEQAAPASGTDSGPRPRPCPPGRRRVTARCPCRVTSGWEARMQGAAVSLLSLSLSHIIYNTYIYIGIIALSRARADYDYLDRHHDGQGPGHAAMVKDLRDYNYLDQPRSRSRVMVKDQDHGHGQGPGCEPATHVRLTPTSESCRRRRSGSPPPTARDCRAVTE